MKKITEFFDRFSKSTLFQKSHILIGFIVPLTLHLMGLSYISSIMYGLFAGLFKEIIHCYSPMKSVGFGKFKVKIVDWEALKFMFSSMNFIKKHEFGEENYYFNICGLIIFTIVNLIF